MITQVYREVAPLQQEMISRKLRGQKIVLVPTMGNLHAGHISLMKRAMQEGDLVVVSIFVNPTQFAPNEDFAAYPRTFEADTALINAEIEKDVIVFCPFPDQMYAPDFSTWVNEDVLSQGLCGRSRPIHFRGVTTVVAKLFNIVLPDVAIFGQKDAQQSLIIQRMVRDLNFPIQIIVSPIVREHDGLAMSSRNQYLSVEERKVAPGIYAALQHAVQCVREDQTILPEMIHAQITDALVRLGGDIDYVEILNASDLLVAKDFKQTVLIAVACRLGKTRLIDNVLIGV